ncbi:MAG TPA: alpha/beta fold hydrolase [Thermoanaerobaculia bacterium]|nr:alpha/beta fold hydrolase [Thermoanaerobaculia bacterium]
MALICLHGFLGRGADWDFLRDAGFDVVAPSLFAGDSLDSVRPDSDDVLLGYSMGARLALQLMQTHRVAKAILVSAGLAPAEPGRQELDETWAKRFESNEPWESIIDAWNRQSVFGGRANPLTRNEADYDRRKLAAALRRGRQLHLTGITVPTLWIAGEDDVKYRDAARRAAEQVHGEFWLCPSAAHRVPWEQPAAFIARLREFADPADDAGRTSL